MSFTFTPGNIVVDEVSTWGQHAHLPSSETANWPDGTRWLASLRTRLGHIDSTRVGHVLLEAIAARPVRGMVASIVRLPRTAPEAWTDGPVAPGTPGNSSAVPVVFVSFTPADARGLPIDISPMHHPSSVLAHELAHVLMNMNGLSALTLRGRPNPISSWTSVAYPNHNEFCATTIQNMVLSEMGVRLSDGYHDAPGEGDDPAIQNDLNLSGATINDFGVRTRSSVDMGRYVALYREPLEFLRRELPGFTGRLAGLTGLAFNPFAHLATPSRARGATAVTGGSGAARRPGPIDISPH